ncbi:hypothetical protein [Evansella clarkii]|nr:hypothetical protein [Evansella clarkii]
MEQTNVSGEANEEDCLGTAAIKVSFLEQNYIQLMGHTDDLD